MPQLKEVRTSLEVGFSGSDAMPERFAHLRGREWRAIAALDEFPYEDAQFEVVVMAGSAVTRERVKEAHRVLRPEGSLYFMVPEKSGNEPGYTLPDIYAIVREGFNIVGLERARWWWPLLRKRRTLTIRACKKNWKSLNGTFRPYV
jgi:SAM-dependent methyltransferase